MSIDNVKTSVMKLLSSEHDQPPKDECPTCNGNGFIGLDDKIIVCPTCNGSKKKPTQDNYAKT
jgi:DnaJ-class molecular chaperone